MNLHTRRRLAARIWVALGLLTVACDQRQQSGSGPSSDPELARRGSIEVTAKLVEVPEGAIFERPLYNYATVLKYQVLEVHRGRVKGDRPSTSATTIRSSPDPKAADQRVQDDRRQLSNRSAPEMCTAWHWKDPCLTISPGGILNKYSEEDTDPIYWAVWTDLVSG